MEQWTRRQQKIYQWMLDVTEIGEHRFDDLHVDKIDAQWSEKEMWFEGGLEALRTALAIRSTLDPNVVVVLAFSLSEAAAYPFATREEIEALFDWSPPSLYLFSLGKEPWTNSGYNRIEQVDPKLFSDDITAISAFYAEFPAARHRRTLPNNLHCGLIKRQPEK